MFWVYPSSPAKTRVTFLCGGLKYEASVAMFSSTVSLDFGLSDSSPRIVLPELRPFWRENSWGTQLFWKVRRRGLVCVSVTVGVTVCVSLWVLPCVCHCGCLCVCVSLWVLQGCVSLWVLLCGCHCGCYSVCVGVTVGITVCVCVTAGVTACVCHCGCKCVSVSMWVLLCVCVCHCGCYSVCVSLWMFVCVRVWCTYRHVLQKNTSKRNMKWTFPVYYIWENKIIVSVVCDF